MGPSDACHVINARGATIWCMPMVVEVPSQPCYSSTRRAYAYGPRIAYAYYAYAYGLGIAYDVI